MKSTGCLAMCVQGWQTMVWVEGWLGGWLCEWVGGVRERVRVGGDRLKSWMVWKLDKGQTVGRICTFKLRHTVELYHSKQKRYFVLPLTSERLMTVSTETSFGAALNRWVFTATT